MENLKLLRKNGTECAVEDFQNEAKNPVVGIRFYDANGARVCFGLKNLPQTNWEAVEYWADRELSFLGENHFFVTSLPSKSEAMRLLANREIINSLLKEVVAQGIEVELLPETLWTAVLVGQDAAAIDVNLRVKTYDIESSTKLPSRAIIYTR